MNCKPTLYEEMADKADMAASFLKGIASAHRLLILCQLAEGEKSVSELVASTGIAQTSMSQHLSKLKQEQIVDWRREHRTLFYRISNDAARQIMTVLYDKFCGSFDDKD